MLIKLALRNLRRSLKDYAIYFFALTMAVTLFQMFRTATSQEAFVTLSSKVRYELLRLGELLQIAMNFILVILAFLILYANRFMLKRRSREMGTYMILGMKPLRLSIMLTLEIIVVNAMAVAIGAILGTFAAQWLSIIIQRLTGAEGADYQFIYSASSTRATLLSFVVITLLVLVMMVLQLSRYQLIDLLRPRRRKQSQEGRGAIWVIGFILASVLLGIAYHNVTQQNDPQLIGPTMVRSVLLGILGTFLLMASLTRLILLMARRIKPLYFRSMNLMILRNLSFRMNMFWASMAIICLLLFFSLGVLLIMVTTMKQSQNLEAQLLAPGAYSLESTFDMTFNETHDPSMVEAFEAVKAKLESGPLAYLVAQYPGTRYKVIRGHLINIEEPIELTTDYKGFMVIARSEADRVLGDVKLPASASEYLLIGHARKPAAIETTEWAQAHLHELRLTPQTTWPVDQVLSDDIYHPLIGNLRSLVYVVPDAALTQTPPKNYAISYGFVLPDDVDIEAFYEAFSQITNTTFWSLANLQTDEQRLGLLEFGEHSYIPALELASDRRDSSLIILIAAYFGANFLLISATILSLQFLSELSDNRRRYRLASAIGASPSDIRRSLIAETAFYFAIPFAVALFHSIFSFQVVAKPAFFTDARMVYSQAPLAIGIVGAFLLAYFVLTAYSAVRMVMPDRVS